LWGNGAGRQSGAHGEHLAFGTFVLRKKLDGNAIDGLVAEALLSHNKIFIGKGNQGWRRSSCLVVAQQPVQQIIETDL
jgi:hypothetical protein